jgi:hypothetical protein
MVRGVQGSSGVWSGGTPDEKPPDGGEVFRGGQGGQGLLRIYRACEMFAVQSGCMSGKRWITLRPLTTLTAGF